MSLRYMHIGVPHHSKSVDTDKRTSLLAEVEDARTALIEARQFLNEADPGQTVSNAGWILHHAKHARGGIVKIIPGMMLPPRGGEDGQIRIWESHQSHRKGDESPIDRFVGQMDRDLGDPFSMEDRLSGAITQAKNITAAEARYGQALLAFAQDSPYEELEEPSIGPKVRIPPNEGYMARISRLGVSAREAVYTHLLLEKASSSLT